MFYFVKKILAPTFEELADKWLEGEYTRYAPVSAPKKRRLLVNSVYPFIGYKKITSVKPQDIVDIILNYRETAPQSTKKLAQILHRIFV